MCTQGISIHSGHTVVPGEFLTDFDVIPNNEYIVKSLKAFMENTLSVFELSLGKFSLGSCAVHNT